MPAAMARLCTIFGGLGIGGGLSEAARPADSSRMSEVRMQAAMRALAQVSSIPTLHDGRGNFNDEEHIREKFQGLIERL